MTGEATKTCIYCAERPAHPGEHAVPAALGTFPPFDARLAVMCKADQTADQSGCNVTLGNALYTPLFQQSPYSTIRRYVPWEIGRKRTRKGRVRGKGYHLPEVQGEGDLQGLLADAQPGMTLGNLAHLIKFRTEDGEVRSWVVPDGVSNAGALKKAIARAGHDGDAPERVIAHPESELWGWMRELYPRIEIRMEDLVQPGEVMDVLMGGEINVTHVRGLAKMAFHMFLWMHDARGDEPGFANFRQFIQTGESDFPCFNTAVFPIDRCPLGALEDHCPARIKHIYSDRVTARGELIIDLCLFAGTPAPLHWWRFGVTGGLSPTTPPTDVALVYHAAEPIEVNGQLTDGGAVALPHHPDRIEILAPPDWTEGETAVEGRAD